MANPRTEAAVAEMAKWVSEGNELYPMFWSHTYGRATCSAAIRVAKARGLIVEADEKNGLGEPKYVSPVKDMPAVSTTIN